MKELLAELLPDWLAGNRRDQLLYVLTLGLLGVGTFLCVVAVRFSRLEVVAVALASAGAASWLLSNKAGEGSILWVLQPGNGLTTADLAVIPAGLLIVALSVRRLLAGEAADRHPDVGQTAAGSPG